MLFSCSVLKKSSGQAGDVNGDENAEIANRMATKMLRKVQRKVGFAERGRR